MRDNAGLSTAQGSVAVDILSHQAIPVEGSRSPASGPPEEQKIVAIVLGRTGSGKSSLCNATLFPVSTEATSCTQQIASFNVYFIVQKSKPLSIIATVGFGDPPKKDIHGSLVHKLKKDIGYINCFIITVNGPNRRLDDSMDTMLLLLENIFTEKVWNQVAIVFTHLCMKSDIKKRKEKTYGGKADDQIASSYITYVQNKFPAAKNTNLKYHVIDAMYENNNKEETKYFETESNKLFGFIRTRPSISTQEVKRIITENEKLRQEIENKTMRWWRACANRFFYTS